MASLDRWEGRAADRFSNELNICHGSRGTDGSNIPGLGRETILSVAIRLMTDPKSLFFVEQWRREHRGMPSAVEATRLAGARTTESVC